MQQALPALPTSLTSPGASGCHQIINLHTEACSGPGSFAVVLHVRQACSARLYPLLQLPTTWERILTLKRFLCWQSARTPAGAVWR